MVRRPSGSQKTADSSAVASSRPNRHMRWERLDALRGLAMVWMTAYHFCFDLQYFGWMTANFSSDPFWTWQRASIVSLFLVCAGSGQAIAVQQGQSWQRFGKRWMQIAAAASLVTLGSWWMYPQSFIYFGVLHGMAVMLLIVRFTTHWGQWLWLTGAVAMASKWAAAAVLASHPQWLFFNEKAYNWIGWISTKPRTEDYVPLLPWLGVVWWGVALTQLLLRHQPQFLTGPLPNAFRPLAWMGAWSLLYYLLHQPVLLGLMQLVQWLSLLKF